MDETTTPSTAAGGGVSQEERPLTPEEEIAELEKLLTTEGEDFQARCRLGELYFSQGRLDDALNEVKKSIDMAEALRTEMNRSLAMYYSNLGTIYGTKGMIDEAEAQFKKALEVFPELRRAYDRELIDAQFMRRTELDAAEAKPRGETVRQTRERHPPIDDVAAATAWWDRLSRDADDKSEGLVYDDDVGNADVSEYGAVAEPYRAPPKVGRNEPCPCGSGKKYKKCCGQ